MTIRSLRSAAWAGLILLAVAGLSCDALNPAFVGQLGGNVAVAGPEPTGSIVLVFNNQRAELLALSYDLEVSRPGEAAQTVTDGFLQAQNGYWTATFDCNVTAITLTGISEAGTTTQPANGGLTLAVNEFRRPALVCGSVVFVNVPLVGSPTADLLP